MADVFLEVFAGDANDPPPNATQLEGGAIVWELTGGGRARCDDSGHTGTPFYRYEDFVGRKAFGASLRAQFANPTTEGRAVRLCFDVIDAENYLYLEFASGNTAPGWTGVGTPEVALGKVVGGVETILHGPVTVNGGSSLTADTLYLVEFVRMLDVDDGSVDYEVRFEESWLDDPRPTPLFTYNDGGNLTYRNERLGWKNTIPADGSELEIDDLRAFELVDDETDAGDDYLSVDGEALDLATQKARGISPVEFANAYPSGSEFVFDERVRWESRSYRPEQYVELKADGGIRFRGFIHKVEYGGSPGAEVVTYHCRGRRTRLRYVVPTHPTTNAHRLIWNGEQEDYLNAADALQFGYPTKKTYGEIVAWYRDTFAAELRQVGAFKPQNVDGVDQDDLDDLTETPLRTELSGDWAAHVDALLSQLRAFTLLHDNATDVWRILHVAELSQEELDETSDRLIASSLAEDSTGVYTRVCISSVRREVKDATAKVSDASLAEDWDAAHEAVWTPEKAKRKSINATVTAVRLGVGPGGEDEIDVDYDYPPRTYSGEWVDGQLVMTSGAASGETHAMNSQTAGSTAPYSGTIQLDGNFVGTPVVSDTLRLEEDGTPTGLNRFKNVFRRFSIVDPTKSPILRREDGGCPTLKMVVPEVSAGEGETAGKSEELLPFFNAAGGPQNAVAKIAATNPFSNAGASGTCDVEGSFEKPEDVVLDYQYLETTILQACYPASGYAGDAYDAYGDLERVLPMEEPEWKDSTQTAIVTARAQAIHEIVSQRAFVGKPTLDGHHWAFAQLGVALDLGSASRTLPFDGAYILPISVRFKWPKRSTGKTTTLDLGGTATFAESGARFRRELQEKTWQERLKEAELRLRELSSCAGQQAQAEAPDPNPLSPRCASGIRTGLGTLSPPARPSGNEAKDLEVVIEWILDNKWRLDNSVDGLLHNQGKTTDDASGEVLEPGSTVGPDGATYHNPDGSTSDLSEGETVPETVDGEQDSQLDGLLKNLGKTVTPDGTVLEPGASVPAGGATHYGPGGAENPLSEGDTVPPSVLSQLMAEKLKSGLEETNADDPGGPVVESPSGKTYTPDGSGGYAPGGGGGGYTEVDPASGGPGTGTNGGDYEPAVDPYTLVPRLHKQFAFLDHHAGTALTTPSDGDGVGFEPSTDSTGRTEKHTLPADAVGHDADRPVVFAFTFRNDPDDATGGDTVWNIRARHVPNDTPPSAWQVVATAEVVAIAGTGEPTTLVIEADLDTTEGAGGPGGYVEVEIEREGTHMSDTSGDNANVLAVDMDVPVKAAYMEVPE